jgi:nitrogen fixation NifU-like protein
VPALSPVEELYRDVVLDHYRNPRNRTPLAAAHGTAQVDNPLCGDQVVVEVRVEDGRIAEVSSRARGCSVVVASGSVMTELAAGLASGEAAALHQALEDLVHGKPVPEDLDRRLRAFARVADLPSRRRCASLPWEALREALREASA